MILISICFLGTSSLFSQSTTNALPNLLPPLAPLPPTFWEQHGTAVLAGGLIFLAVAALVAGIVLKSRPPRVLPPAIVARETLTKCRARPEDGNVLTEVSQTLRRYAAAALELPPGELTTAEFSRELERTEKITPQLKRSIADFLRSCDDRKFAPAVSSGPLDAAGRALELVDLTEKESCRHNETCAATKNERPV